MGGWVIWEGPSPVTGDTIGVLMTDHSYNTKTGPMLQTWVLVRDQPPQAALRTGADAAICGDCVHRAGVDGQGRTCYVSLFTGPANVWRAWQAGRYPRLLAEEAATLAQGCAIRLTAYGDPAMVPMGVWTALLAGAAGWTGYTHRWRACDPRYQKFLMASVESEAEAALAHRLGWRTFRARAASSPLAADEVVCPASDEPGAAWTAAGRIRGRCSAATGAATFTSATRAPGAPGAERSTLPFRRRSSRLPPRTAAGDQTRAATPNRLMEAHMRRLSVILALCLSAACSTALPIAPDRSTPGTAPTAPSLIAPVPPAALSAPTPNPSAPAAPVPSPADRLAQVLADWAIVVSAAAPLGPPSGSLIDQSVRYPNVATRVLDANALIQQLTAIPVLDSRLVARIESALFALDDQVLADFGSRLLHAQITRVRTDLDAWPNW